MNEEPGWLRSEAAARSRETELDGGTKKPAGRGAGREQDRGLAAEASRALAAGQPEKLRPGAVMHLQRAAGNAGVARFLGEEREPESPVKGIVGRGAGAPLDDASRARMEASFGTDFSDVRVHTGSSAAESARAVDAHAYTVGNEVVLGDGQAPGSPAYERTLAHELMHVVQQRSGPVDGTPAGGGISVSDPADRFERAAEATADDVVSTGRAPEASTGNVSSTSVQRERPLEEEERDPTEADTLPSMAETATAETAQAGAKTPATAETAQAGAAEGAVVEGQPNREPTSAPEAESTAGTAQAGPIEAAPGEEEQEEVQELAIQRQEAPEEDEEVQELAIQRLQRGDDLSGARIA